MNGLKDVVNVITGCFYSIDSSAKEHQHCTTYTTASPSMLLLQMCKTPKLNFLKEYGGTSREAKERNDN